MNDTAVLIVKRIELKRTIKALEVEVEAIENQLKPMAKEVFLRTPDSVRQKARDGVRFTRKLLRTDLKSSDPRKTALFLAGLPVDVFSPGIVAKSKLDSLSPTYSDGKVLLQGEPIPALEAVPVWSYEYEAQSNGVKSEELL